METAEPSVVPASAKAAPHVTAVVVTHNRPVLLRRCLHAIEAQDRRPDAVLVVDVASEAETGRVIADFPRARTLRLTANLGGAAGYRAGAAAALEAGTDWIWLMDDDGRPCTQGCLRELLAATGRAGAEMAAPLVLDVDAPERLAFPIRINGRTRFTLAELRGRGDLPGFAHLFNGALVGAGLLRRIGLPDQRFVIRGDEVEFLLRARRSGSRIALVTDTHFLHPGSAPEIHPIFRGLFYATLPLDPAKQFYQFRNRGWIFSRYGMWPWLAADVIRYGWFFLAKRGDPRAFGRWAAATWTGLSGHFMRAPPPPVGAEPMGHAFARGVGWDVAPDGMERPKA